MAIKVYISGISGNKEVKKRQQRVLMILDSKNIKYEVVDIAEPGNEEPKEFMQSNSKCLGATIGDANPKYPLPPQIFNELDYCGDYDKFDLSNELDEIEVFLKLSPGDTTDPVTSTAEIKMGNGDVHPEVESISTNDNEAEAKPENPQIEDSSLNEKPVGDNEVTTASETDNHSEDVEVEEAQLEEEKVEDETEDANNEAETNSKDNKEDGEEEEEEEA